MKKGCELNRSNDSVKLCFEVQLDDEVKSILYAPNALSAPNSQSKKKGIAFVKHTVNPNKIEITNDESNLTKSMQPLFTEIRRSLKNVETQITDMQDIDLSLKNSKSNSSELKHLKSVLICKSNIFKNGKSEGSCVCENCGRVGFVEDLDNLHTVFQNKTQLTVSENQYQIEDLCERIKMLEERLAVQEEKAVPKDYFKKIITKVLSYISPKLFFSKRTVSQKSSWQKQFFDKESTAKIINSNRLTECYYHELDKSNTHNNSQSDKSFRMTSPNSQISRDLFWEYKEQVMKPENDQKDRLRKLFEEKNIKTPRSTLFQSDDNSTNIKINLDENVNLTYVNPNISLWNKQSVPEYYLGASGTVTKLGREASDSQKTFNLPRVSEKIKQFEKNYNAIQGAKSKSFSSSKRSTISNISASTGKERFFKILSKIKEPDKQFLWESVWGQAQMNGYNRDDILTVKIPKPDGKVLRAKVALGEIEAVLIKNK